MKVIVQFSGGKDSQACLIYACEKFGGAKVTALFCDTGWEHELTYKHVESVVRGLGCNLVVVRNKSLKGFEDMCLKMKGFPNIKARSCTALLKVYPGIDYILRQRENVLIIQGIRAGESAHRSKMSCSADYFGAYKDDEVKKNLYRKAAVRAWCERYSAIVERPFFGESGQFVIEYILQHGQNPNPLYKKGFSRVGCFPCIFARLKELQLLAKDSEYVERVKRLESDVNKLRSGESTEYASFFCKGKIPDRFCKKYGNGIATFEEVIKYASRNESPTLFDAEEEISCMSIYHGLCE